MISGPTRIGYELDVAFGLSRTVRSDVFARRTAKRSDVATRSDVVSGFSRTRDRFDSRTHDRFDSFSRAGNSQNQLGGLYSLRSLWESSGQQDHDRLTRDHRF